MVALKDEADVLVAQVAAFVLIQFVDRLIEEVKLAGPGAVVHSDKMQQGGLTRARRPHDGDELALLDIDVDASQDEGFADTMGVELLDVAELDHKISLIDR